MSTPSLSDFPSPPEDKTGWPWMEESDPPSPRPSDASQWPKISIVTPSYNQGQFIEETIRSILLQRYPNLEYIVMDGGSNDSTVEVLKKYDPWIDHWVSEPDGGQVHAINKGMDLASGSILAYINSDDYYLPGALLEAAQSLHQSGALLFTGRVVKAPEGSVMDPPATDRLEEWIRKFSLCFPQPGTFWIQKNSFPRFDETMECAFDRKFFMQLIAQNASIVRSKEKIAVFRIQPDSKTSQLADTFFEEDRAINYELLSHLPRSKAEQLRKHLQFQDLRRRFHRIPSEQKLRLLRYGLRHPRFLIRREFYGKLRASVD